MNVPNMMTLKVREVQTLKLPSLGTAGYVWNYAVAGDTTAIAVTMSREKPPQVSESPIAIGSSLDEVVTLVGQEPGQATLHLVQQRPWETNQPPLKEYRIEVTVQS